MQNNNHQLENTSLTTANMMPQNEMQRAQLLFQAFEQAIQSPIRHIREQHLNEFKNNYIFHISAFNALLLQIFTHHATLELDPAVQAFINSSQKNASQLLNAHKFSPQMLMAIRRYEAFLYLMKDYPAHQKENDAMSEKEVINQLMGWVFPSTVIAIGMFAQLPDMQPQQAFESYRSITDSLHILEVYGDRYLDKVFEDYFESHSITSIEEFCLQLAGLNQSCNIIGFTLTNNMSRLINRIEEFSKANGLQAHKILQISLNTIQGSLRNYKPAEYVLVLKKWMDFYNQQWCSARQSSPPSTEIALKQAVVEFINTAPNIDKSTQAQHLLVDRMIAILRLYQALPIKERTALIDGDLITALKTFESICDSFAHEKSSLIMLGIIGYIKRDIVAHQTQAGQYIDLEQASLVQHTSRAVANEPEGFAELKLIALTDEHQRALKTSQWLKKYQPHHIVTIIDWLATTDLINQLDYIEFQSFIEMEIEIYQNKRLSDENASHAQIMDIYEKQIVYYQNVLNKVKVLNFILKSILPHYQSSIAPPIHLISELRLVSGSLDILPGALGGVIGIYLSEYYTSEASLFNDAEILNLIHLLRSEGNRYIELIASNISSRGYSSLDDLRPGFCLLTNFSMGIKLAILFCELHAQEDDIKILNKQHDKIINVYSTTIKKLNLSKEKAASLQGVLSSNQTYVISQDVIDRTNRVKSIFHMLKHIRLKLALRTLPAPETPREITFQQRIDEVNRLCSKLSNLKSQVEIEQAFHSITVELLELAKDYLYASPEDKPAQAQALFSLLLLILNKCENIRQDSLITNKLSQLFKSIADELKNHLKQHRQTAGRSVALKRIEVVAATPREVDIETDELTAQFQQAMNIAPRATAIDVNTQSEEVVINVEEQPPSHASAIESELAEQLQSLEDNLEKELSELKDSYDKEKQMLLENQQKQIAEVTAANENQKQKIRSDFLSQLSSERTLLERAYQDFCAEKESEIKQYTTMIAAKYQESLERAERKLKTLKATALTEHEKAKNELEEASNLALDKAFEEKLQQANKAHEEQVRQSTVEHVSQVEMLNMQIEILSSNLLNTEKANQEALKNHEKEQQELKLLHKNVLHSQQVEKGKLESTVVDLQIDKKLLECSVAILRDEMSKLEITARAQQTDKTRLESTVNVLQDEKATLTSEVASLQSEVAKLKIRKEKSQAELASKNPIVGFPAPIRHVHLPAHIQSLLLRLKAAGIESYIVGGFPRKIYLECLTPNDDIDIMINARPKDLPYDILGACYPTPEPRLLQLGNIDIWCAPWKNIVQALKRKDYTINTLICDANGYIYDLLGVIKDFEDKQIRVVGAPKTRFKQDPVIMIRMFRLAGQTEYQIPDYLKEDLFACLPLIVNIPFSRYRGHIAKLFLSLHYKQNFILVNDLNALSKLIPLLPEDYLRILSTRHPYLMTFWQNQLEEYNQRKDVSSYSIIALFALLPLVQTAVVRPINDKNISLFIESFVNKFTKTPAKNKSSAIQALQSILCDKVLDPENPKDRTPGLLTKYFEYERQYWPHNQFWSKPIVPMFQAKKSEPVQSVIPPKPAQVRLLKRTT